MNYLKIFLSFSFVVIAVSSFGQNKFKAPYRINTYCDTLSNDSTIIYIETLDAKGRLMKSDLRFPNGSVCTNTHFMINGGSMTTILYNSDSIGMSIRITYDKKGIPISRLTRRNDSQSHKQFYTKKGALIPKKHKCYVIPI
jgi:hypothetical protein